MTKKLTVITLILALMLSLFAVSAVAEEAETSNVTWTHGSTEEWKELGYTKITQSDTRGYIPAPNLDEAPYYMVLGMDGVMPAGDQKEGGRWAQLHISDTEHASSSNPSGDLYISIPNANARPRNITVYTRTDNETKMYGVPFTTLTANVVKFAKEQDESGTDVLAIYINGTKVFQGADQLRIFQGENLHFTAIGCEGEYDTFKDYPLFLDLETEYTTDPINAFYTGPKWGMDETCAPQKDAMVTYTADGKARLYLLSTWDDFGINQSTSTTFFNNQKKFDLFMTMEAFNFESWEFLTIRPGSGAGFANDDPNALNIELGSGPAYSIWYKDPNRNRIDLVGTEVYNLNEEVRFHFAVVNVDGKNVVEIYINDVLKGTSDNEDLVALLSSHTVKVINAGHNSLTEVPMSMVVDIDNTPADFTPQEPGAEEEEENDPYKDLVLTSNNSKVTLEDMLISVKQKMTVAQLKAALVAPEGTVLYVMDAAGDVAADGDVLDSTYSVMMLLDDEYETYIRSYYISAFASGGNSGNTDNDGNDDNSGNTGDSSDEDNGTDRPLSPPTGDGSVLPAVLLTVLSAVVVAVMKKAKVAQA